MFMLQAIDQARAAKDDHGRVGAVLVQHGKVISVAGSSSLEFPTIHAEHAALEKAGWLNDPTPKPNSKIYVTLQPCLKRSGGEKGCSWDIINSGIEKVVYGELDTHFEWGESLKFFNSHGVMFEQIPYTAIRKECWKIFCENNKSMKK